MKIIEQLLKSGKEILSRFFCWPRGESENPPKPTLESQYNEIQEIESRLENIGFWLSQNQQVCTEEILQQYQNAESRLAALSSAVLIKLRNDQEIEAAERIKMQGLKAKQKQNRIELERLKAEQKEAEKFGGVK